MLLFHTKISPRQKQRGLAVAEVSSRVANLQKSHASSRCACVGGKIYTSQPGVSKMQNVLNSSSLFMQRLYSTDALGHTEYICLLRVSISRRGVTGMDKP